MTRAMRRAFTGGIYAGLGIAGVEVLKDLVYAIGRRFGTWGKPDPEKELTDTLAQARALMARASQALGPIDFPPQSQPQSQPQHPQQPRPQV